MKKSLSLKGWMILSMLAVVVFLSSCAKSAYRNAIPADAPVVAELDVKTIGIKSNFFEQKDKVADLIVSYNPDDQTLHKIADALRSPESMGLDLLSPMYVYAASSIDDFYFLASVRSQSDFVKTLTSISDEFEMEKDGKLSWISVEGRVIGVVTNQALLIGSSNQKTRYRELLDLGGSDSFFSTDAGKFMKKHTGDATVLFNMTAFSRQQQRQMRRQIERKLDSSLRMLSSDELWEQIFSMKVVANLEFTPGKIAVNMYGDGADNKKTDVLKKISKDVFKQVPQRNLVALMAIGIDGPKCWENVDEDTKALARLMSGEDRSIFDMVEQMFTSTDGTAVVTLSGKDLKNDPKALCILPTPKSVVKPLISLIGDEMPRGVFVDGDKKYTSITNITDYEFGEVKNPFDKASRATSSYIYAYVPAEPLISYMNLYFRNADSEDAVLVQEIMSIAELMDFLELKMEKKQELQLALLLVNDSKNSLALLLEHTIDLMNVVIDQKKAEREAYENAYYNYFDNFDEDEEWAEEVVADEYEYAF